MPAESIPVVAVVLAIFGILIVTLAGMQIYTARGTAPRDKH